MVVRTRVCTVSAAYRPLHIAGSTESISMCVRRAGCLVEHGAVGSVSHLALAAHPPASR